MPNRLAGKTILVVEDQAFIGFDLCEALEAAGSKAICLDTLARALKALQEHDFDAAVLDYHLPDGVSTEICEGLERRDIPYVIHTGYGDIKDACAHADKLLKPANVDEIVEHVKRLVTSRPSSAQPGPSVQL